jgi:hypothetical protein
MSSMRFYVCFDMSHHGPPHPYKDAGVVADSLDRHPQCDGEVSLRYQPELHTQGVLGVPTGKTEYSNFKSLEDMQWDLLYLSIGHDGCYREHPAQHG